MNLLTEIEIIIPIIVAIFASGGFWQYIMHKNITRDARTSAILALLHDKLYYLCEKHLKNGYISIEELDNIEYLYIPYEKLGGNGVIENLYDKVKKLPLKKL